MQLVINGEDHRDLPDRMSVTDLIAYLELPAGKIAVEHNREVVPKSLHATTQLSDGDVLEIIHFIGGG